MDDLLGGCRAVAALTPAVLVALICLGVLVIRGVPLILACLISMALGGILGYIALKIVDALGI